MRPGFFVLLPVVKGGEDLEGFVGEDFGVLEELGKTFLAFEEGMGKRGVGTDGSEGA